MTRKRTFPQLPQHGVLGDPASITEVELLNELQRKIFHARRAQRRYTAITLVLVVSVFLCAAVTIQSTDLDIQPNQVAADPDDSYELKLIGDGDTSAVEMTFKTIPTTAPPDNTAIPMTARKPIIPRRLWVKKIASATVMAAPMAI